MKINLFENWEFCLSNQSIPAYEVDEQYEWRQVQLPHDWSTDYPIDQNAPTCGSGGYVVAGIGWYRRTIEVTRDMLEEQVLLYFEGSYMNTSVYVNRHKVGNHIYGYTPFEIEISKELKVGQNELWIVVDNSMQPGSRWYSGSGITRNLWLETRKHLHIARYGTFLTTDISAYPKGDVHVELVLHHQGQDNHHGPRNLSIRVWWNTENQTDILALEESLTQQWEMGDSEAFIQSGIDKSVQEDFTVLKHNFTISLDEPRLWDDESPNLYQLTIQLIENGCVIDSRVEKIGFREIVFDANKGFIINGVQKKLNGVCLHHDGGCVGAAVPPRVWQRRLKKLKDMGVNAIRFSHNPPDESLMDLCDQLGFYVMDEAFDEWAIMKWKDVGANTHESHGYSLYFAQCHEWDLKTMVYRDRNHPCVILWSIGNEIPEQVVEGGHQLAATLKRFCKQVDPTRCVTLANDQIVAEPRATKQEFLEELDVVGYNYVARWRKRAELFYDEDRFAFPHRCVIGTENPSAGYTRGCYKLDYDKTSFWDKPYYTAPVLVGKLLRYTMTHDFVAGDFMWTGIDYLGEANWPYRASGSGCLDTCGFEKDAYYFYKSIWNQDTPFAYLCPHWNLTVEPGTIVSVLCYTNCNDAELFCNGKSYGRKTKGFPCYGMTEKYGHFDWENRPANTDDLFLSWDVPYIPGIVEVVGYKNGQECCRYRMETAGAGAKLECHCEHNILQANGRDVAEIEIQIVDEQGRINPAACDPITVEIDGEVNMLGFDNGNPQCHELWKNCENRTVFHGKAYLVVQSKKTKGTATIRVYGERLLPGEVELTMV